MWQTFVGFMVDMFRERERKEKDWKKLKSMGEYTQRS